MANYGNVAGTNTIIQKQQQLQGQQQKMTVIAATPTTTTRMLISICKGAQYGQIMITWPK